MLKKLMNECIIQLKIIPQGPILIKGPDLEKDESNEDNNLPDMKFVMICRNNREEQYLPGSSLKGVIRNQAEKIARSLASNFGCCNPFWTYRKEGVESESDEISCSDKLEILSIKERPEVYKLSCPVCKLFGNSSLGSRFAISDAYLATAVQTQLPYRDGVAIDRFTGGTKSGAKFRYEVLEKGEFATDIRIRNFELWQLGLVSYVLKDVKDGVLRIGFGKRRGLGKVIGQATNIKISYFGAKKPEWKDEETSFKIWGIGNQLNDSPYGFESNDNDLKIEAKDISEGIRKTFMTDLDNLSLSTAGCWNDYIEKYPIPDEMRYDNVKDKASRKEAENAADIQR
jgi:CRISPR-associated RAMP protein (TIGR02581 family)